MFAIKKTFFLLVAFLAFSGTVSALDIQNLSGTEVRGDFVLGPGKTELFMEPGESITRKLTVTNRLGKEMNFKVEIEDFTGSHDPDKTTVLLGDEKGPYSLRDYLNPEEESFTLQHGQRISLPIKISIPEDAEPGGLYGAVIVSTTPVPIEGEEIDEAAGQVQLISRVGTLFFVRVKGDIEEDGLLTGFSTDKKYLQKSPVSFNLLYENRGNTHLVPYGTIEIKNLLGKKVGEVEVDPYFSMPDSMRTRTVDWDGGFLLGRYKATLLLNRGYEDIIDRKDFYFWVIPWKLVSTIGLALLLIIFFFAWVISRFEIKKKPSLKDNEKP